MLGGIALVGVAMYVYGALLFGGQAYGWLRSGTWESLPSMALFIDTPIVEDAVDSPVPTPEGPPESLRRYIPRIDIRGLSDWLRHPTSWIGVHRMTLSTLTFLSLPVAALVAGLGLFGIATRLWLELG